jgi:hypothetical protein
LLAQRESTAAVAAKRRGRPRQTTRQSSRTDDFQRCVIGVSRQAVLACREQDGVAFLGQTFLFANLHNAATFADAPHFGHRLDGILKAPERHGHNIENAITR